MARERLCLRATADYWVNAMDGQPFFVVSQALEPRLLQVLEQEIIPRLERDVPREPTPAELAADPLLHRFTVVFDREGYNPAFIARMKQKRIACLTYHKHPGGDGHARSLLRAVCSSEIDLLPNAKDKTLTVRLHPLANQSSDDAVRHLCAELNRTELLFPGTELRIVYELVSSHNR